MITLVLLAKDQAEADDWINAYSLNPEETLVALVPEDFDGVDMTGIVYKRLPGYFERPDLPAMETALYAAGAGAVQSAETDV